MLGSQSVPVSLFLSLSLPLSLAEGGPEGCRSCLLPWSHLLLTCSPCSHSYSCSINTQLFSSHDARSSNIPACSHSQFQSRFPATPPEITHQPPHLLASHSPALPLPLIETSGLNKRSKPSFACYFDPPVLHCKYIQKNIHLWRFFMI